MTKTTQGKKNAALSEKLSQHLMDHPILRKDLPDDVIFVLFSAKDKKLNIANKRLIHSLTEEGKYVIKAVETEDVRTPWKFIPA